MTTSPDFSEFLQVLGDSIELKGWPHFRGGLDVKGEPEFIFLPLPHLMNLTHIFSIENTTGLHSVYTKVRFLLLFMHMHAANHSVVERL